MSLSIFDDDDLVESLGYSRDYDVSQRFAFSVHRKRSAEVDRENFARWYARTKADPRRYAAYLARQRVAVRNRYRTQRAEQGLEYVPRSVRSAQRKAASAKGRPWCLTPAQVAEIVTSSERGIVLAARLGVTEKCVSYHRTRHRRMRGGGIALTTTEAA